MKLSRRAILLIAENAGACKHGVHGDTAAFDSLATTLLAVYQYQCCHYLTAFSLNGIYSFQGGTAGSDNIIHHNYLLTGGKVAFYALASAVVFCLLANGEHTQRFLCSGRIHTDGQRYRICPHGHTSNSLSLGELGQNLLLHQLPTHLTDEVSTTGI